MGMTARVVSELFSVCMGDVTKLLEETGSVIYVQEDNWETSITICLNVLNLLMKKKIILILLIYIDLMSLNIIT
jgi:hypothetical protein